jgi:tripartite-type tricarboxylate transporter receptor subunit TctC
MPMPKLMNPCRVAVAIGTSIFVALALAQPYPTKTITVISNVVGGGPEAAQRAVFDRVKEVTGVSVVYEGRPGGAGAPGLQATKRATPDGYTFGVTYASALNLNPFVSPELDLDPLKDFLPVTNLMSLGILIGARADFPVTNLNDLLAQGKARPGAIRFGISGAGNRSYLAMFKDRTGAEFLAIPTSGAAQALQLMLGGNLDVFFTTVGQVTSQAGKLKPVAWGGARPNAALAGVQLVREVFPGVDLTSWFGVVAPARTPPPAIAWVQRELSRAVRHPPVAAVVEKLGFDVVGDTTEEFGKQLREEIELMRELVKKFNIQPG